MPAKKASKKSATSRTRGQGLKSAKKPVSGRSGASRAASKKTGLQKSVRSGRRAGAGKKSAKRRDRAGLAPANVLVVNMIPLSLSGETNQDSEPNIAVNPANPLQIVGSAFTPDPFGGTQAPIFISNDGGNTWSLKSIVPSNLQTGDITVGFSRSTNNLYSGILKRPGTLLLNILRTNNASAPTPMKVLSNRTQVDQPHLQATTVNSKDRVYVGNNDFEAPGGRTATVDVSLDAAASSPSFRSIRIETRNTGSAGQNGPQIRLAAHPDGVVYAAFYGWRARSFSDQVTADVVVVRDDNGGSGPNPFRALVDSDGLAGKRVTQGVKFVWEDSLGQQRLGGDIAIAVDPTNSAIVYLAWADKNPTTGYTLHLRRSTDRGVTWSPNDLRTIGRATNPALAVNSNGKVGFLYQRVTGMGASQRWVTQLERSLDGINWDSLILATVPANTPAPQFQPYIGDYDHLIAVGKDFYGIFSANNSPDLARFPNGVKYQRRHDFNTRRLLDLSGNTVAVSIDPFFVKVVE